LHLTVRQETLLIQFDGGAFYGTEQNNGTETYY